MKPGKSLHAKTDQGEVADWYDDLVGEDGSEYHSEVVLPGVLKPLDLKKGDLVFTLRDFFSRAGKF